MRKFKTLAVLSYQPALHYGISGLIFLLSLAVAQAAPIIIDGGATRNEVGSSPPSVNNDMVDGQNLAIEEYKSKGITASVESGYTFKIGENTAKNPTYFIQPKVQVTWMDIKADDHIEANGTHVSSKGNGNIQTRLGVKTFMSGDADQDRDIQPFMETNWVHNTKNFGTTMDGIRAFSF